MKSNKKKDTAGPTSPTNKATAKTVAPPTSVTWKIREIFDELIFVIVLVMFLRLFIVELYKIPTGSMTPTLLGGAVARLDLDNDKDKDLVYLSPSGNRPLVFTWEEDRYVHNGLIRPNVSTIKQRGLIHNQFNRILVNKFAYWFSTPRRGDIVVFKTPRSIFRPEAPIYVKRLTGEPGDTLTFGDKGELIANGTPVTEPDFFRTQLYRDTVDPNTWGYSELPYADYTPVSRRTLRLDAIRVPEGQAFVFGDNTHGSLDSRYWGGVPMDNFKGLAFLRISWPFKGFKFLH